MKFKVLILSALRNLNRNKKRSFLTMLGIIIGIASVITIVALGNAMKNEMMKSMNGEDTEQIKLQAIFASEDITIDMSSQSVFSNLEKQSVGKLEQVDKVELIYGTNSFGDMIMANIRGTDFQGLAGKVKSSSNPGIIGRDITESDNINNRKVLVINENLLKESKLDSNEMLGALATINGINFEIVGIIPIPEEENINFMPTPNISIPENTYDKYLYKEQMPQGLDITLKKKMDVKESIKAIEEKLNEVGSKREYGKYSVVDNGGVTKFFGKVFNTLTTFIASVAGISLFIAGVGVMNMVYTSISERTLEIGIKRAIGAKKKDIRREFLLEGIVITLTGGLIGYVVGIIVAMIISVFIKMKVSPDIFTASIAIGLSVLIGLLSSILPARKAANANTVDILK
ncbi:ABC transporter permease [Clostridium gasigenes]|uniref:ABC transporter permease n=1 Tax=Clostridium gasigenes TaxID=94869 RepID=UPI001C0C1F8B|nr:FtsX-like permease family protein [Clostridium gasigenes]MBU3104629.1 ABC transporter permease [Clostridium gasigenes]MBU3136863.1 ABC transporter permease [Clostridium gasigenes]